jgi:glycerophosphoryl diester phosphodiesterase
VLPFVERLEEGGPGFVEACHDAEVRVGTWLTDEPTVAVRLMRLGVDAVATNDPRRILAARHEAFGA